MVLHYRAGIYKNIVFIVLVKHLTTHNDVQKLTE